MPNHEQLYTDEAEMYDLLISSEDYEGNLLEALRAIHSFESVDLADIGAGTGRLSSLLAPYVRSIVATDASQAMLDVADRKLASLGFANWKSKAADNRTLPLPDNSADVAAAGWTVCYVASDNVPGWEGNLRSVMSELERIVRPGGTVIIVETMGTGGEHPSPPDFLKPYYAKLEQTYGFEHRWIRTDFRFQSAVEAERLTRFFFGDELAEACRSAQSNVLPSCTGIWWKKLGV